MLISADYRGRIKGIIPPTQESAREGTVPLGHLKTERLNAARGVLKRFLYAMWKWGRSGFRLLGRLEARERLKRCQGCASWQPESILGLGRCTACGCSGLKRWLPTESCPKWSPILPRVQVSVRLAQPREAASLILAHYSKQRAVKRKPRPNLRNHVLYQCQAGLGDTLMLTDIAHASRERGEPVPVSSESPHFRVLLPGSHVPDRPGTRIELFDLYWNYDCGAGHLIQRLRRAFGVPVDPLPKAHIPPGLSPGPGEPGRVILHFEAGPHAQWQRQHLHPRARQLYPENAAILERFIAGHPGWEFCQVGWHGPVLRGARPCLNLPLAHTIRLMAKSQWFIGIISGPMHLATALGLKCIVLINFPDPALIFLPNLVSTAQVEEEWFYPQNVHLHQDGRGPLVPQFSRVVLDAALAGEVYPFWKKDCLDLQIS